MSLFEHKISELHQMLHKKEITVTDLVDESYKRIGEVEDKVKAFITLNEEAAREQAAKLDEELSSRDQFGLLFGMPIGVKDNIVTNGLRKTCASKILADYDPIYYATVTQKLHNA